MKREELTDLVAWLLNNRSRIQYGKINITLIQKAGKTVRIEKSLMEQELPEGGRHE
jgi:hypothetical protein